MPVARSRNHNAVIMDNDPASDVRHAGGGVPAPQTTLRTFATSKAANKSLEQQRQRTAAAAHYRGALMSALSRRAVLAGSAALTGAGLAGCASAPAMRDTSHDIVDPSIERSFASLYGPVEGDRFPIPGL